MQLSKTQVQAILTNAPPGVDKTQILDGLITRGYQLEGVDTAQAQASIATRNGTAPSVVPAQSPSLGQLDAQQVQQGTKHITDAIQRGADRFATAPTVAGKTSALLESGLGSAAGGVQAVFAPFTAVAQKIGDVTGLTKLVQNIAQTKEGQAAIAPIAQWAEANPDAARNLNDAVTVATAAVGDVGSAKNFLNADVGATTKTVAGAISEVPGQVSTSVKNTIDQVSQQAADLRKNVQTTIASKNVNPQLQESASRLFLDGTAKANPVATYDSYFNQSKKALTDIKVDPAISTVGEDMGNAFNKVIAQRRAVGKVLGDELKTTGKIKVDVTAPKTNLLAELKDSGLAYNPKTNQLTSFTGSKFAPQEVSMLQDFVQGVQRLGDNPSVSAIDQFITKTRTQLKFAQGSSGVIGTTNAERIIDGGLGALKESLNPAKNGIPALTKYWGANQTYSNLSNFIKDGSKYLGKLSQAGDYVKDASVAKSAVQSILNNGKKDFMVQLEALTGYPALDKSVLALQAMKDAGDFRGLSMLQQLSEGAIPTSKAGVVGKILDYGLSKGAEVVAGSAEEQTRAFLRSLVGNNRP